MAHPPRTVREQLRAWVAIVPVLLLALWIFAPFFDDVRAMGFQDWDSQAAYRYVTVLALRHGQAPWWNPWFCGGFPAWGYVEGATNFISPWAPLYFLFSFPLALRLEVVAATFAGAAGAFLLAGRFTRSPAWRAFVAAIWILDSRWALQIASGHLWHLAYAWTPFVLYFVDRAIEEQRRDLAAAGGAMLALMVYVGGIYPYPHTLMVLWLYALGRAIGARSRRPLALFLFAMLTSFGLAAPKLAPVLATMSRFPRLIESNEPVSLHSVWVMLTARQQGFDFYPHLPLRVFWVWWEWGAYVGVAGVVALVVALAVGWTPRLVSLKVAALCCVVLSLGQSIWLLVHHLPLFSSQHLPARLLFLAILLLALVLAGAADEPWARFAQRRRWAEAVALALVCLYGIDLATISRQATVAPFRLQVPPVAPSVDFRQEKFQHYRYGKPSVSHELRDRYEWPAKIIYPSMLANTGMVSCYGIPPEAKSTVVGSDEAGYRGLVFLASGGGRAELTRWTPNAITVRVTGASPGELLVYDMSFDPGWHAGGAPAENWRGLVGAKLEGGDQTVEITYRPYGLTAGLILFAFTTAALGLLLARDRRRRRPEVSA
ncbi:MAG TPA: hypothetical protein VH853_15200 [Polyangia bacterium]|nr:hypothetical protein [Polyangia bacterium]